jgi:hypothetical protein
VTSTSEAADSEQPAGRRLEVAEVGTSRVDDVGRDGRLGALDGGRGETQVAHQLQAQVPQVVEQSGDRGIDDGTRP